MFLDIYTGTLSCIVKLPDEVFASHTKRVGEDKIFYNSRSLQKCCSLVYPFKIILKLSCSMNYDGRVLHATTIILDSGDLSWSCRKKKRSCQKKELCRKKKYVPEKTDVVKKKLDEKN